MDLKLAVSVIGGILGTIFVYVEKYKEIVSWIALRVEKDSADGDWTNKEKEQMAVDLYQKIRSKFPWYIRIIPSYFTSKIIRSLIKKLCKASHKLKKK